MGIHDRDYYRDDSGGLLSAWGRQGVTVWLIVVTCGVWLAQLVSADAGQGGVTDFGIYDPRLILGGEVWRLLTPVFLHSESKLLHIAFNMLILYWAGSRLEERYGGREFLAFYLVAGVSANLIYLLAYVAHLVLPSLALGASGAVTAVLVVYAFLNPRQQVLLFFVIPMPIWLMVAIYVVVDALGAVGGRVGNEPVAYVVHLGGALFGFLYYQSGWRLTGMFSGSTPTPRRRAAPRLRVVPAEPDDGPPDERREAVGAVVEPGPRAGGMTDESIESRVDRVLDKVSKLGQDSLTSEEREILFRASEVFKRRRK